MDCRNYYRCDAGLVTNKKKTLKETLNTLHVSGFSLQRREAILRFTRQSYEISNVFMRLVVMNALFSTIIHILKVQDKMVSICI